MALLRKPWFRVLVIGVALACVNVLLVYVPMVATRNEAIRALQSSTLVFAICSALSIALFSNYVKGLREAYLKRVSDVRDRLESFFDEHRKSSDPDIQEIVTNYVVPLLNLSTREWVTFDPIKEISETTTEPGTRLHAKDSTFLPRHLLRIEDEINEIGLLYICRIISGLHLETISGTFVLVAVGILALGFSYLLPPGDAYDLVVVNISSAIVVFAVLELLLILSYLKQEGREEQPEENPNEDFDEI